MPSTAVRLRPVVPGDEPFLCAVYISTRMEELTVTGWSDAQKREFLEGQFAAQHQHYQTHYADAEFSVILDGEIEVGRLYVARWPAEIRIVDIALLPDYRSRGIGSTLLRDILAEAASAGIPARIHVEIFNPARRLYERLGFRVIEDKGVYLLLEWTPPAQLRAASSVSGIS